MATDQIVNEVKLGSRVVYVGADGVEHNGIALDTVHVGFNNAIKRFGAFLNLTYLDDEGKQIKVSAAELLASHRDPQFLDKVAEHSARNDARWYGLDADGREELTDEHKARITSNPHVIGWRPGSVATTASQEFVADLLAIAEQQQVPAKVISVYASDRVLNNVHVVFGKLLEEIRLCLGMSSEGFEQMLEQAGKNFLDKQEAAMDNALSKSSGDLQDAGDWTQAGDGTDYPVMPSSMVDDLVAQSAEKEARLFQKVNPSYEPFVVPLADAQAPADDQAATQTLAPAPAEPSSPIPAAVAEDPAPAAATPETEAPQETAEEPAQESVVDDASADDEGQAPEAPPEAVN